MGNRGFCKLMSAPVGVKGQINQLTKGQYSMDNLAQSGGTGNLMMATGTVTSWFWVGIDWTNDHSGLFVALAAVVSTVITVIGAVKANKSRKVSGT
jgi:hypothetical protein